MRRNDLDMLFVTKVAFPSRLNSPTVGKIQSKNNNFYNSIKRGKRTGWDATPISLALIASSALLTLIKFARARSLSPSLKFIVITRSSSFIRKNVCVCVCSLKSWGHSKTVARTKTTPTKQKKSWSKWKQRGKLELSEKINCKNFFFLPFER